MPAINRNSGAAIPPTNWESTYALPSRRSIRVNELNAWHWIMMTTAKPRIQSRKGNLFTSRRAVPTPSDAHHDSGNSKGTGQGERLQASEFFVTIGGGGSNLVLNHGHNTLRHPLRAAQSTPQPAIHSGCSRIACPGHRREHGHLHPDGQVDAAAAAGVEARATGDDLAQRAAHGEQPR